MRIIIRRFHWSLLGCLALLCLPSGCGDSSPPTVGSEQASPRIETGQTNPEPDPPSFYFWIEDAILPEAWLRELEALLQMKIQVERIEQITSTDPRGDLWLASPARLRAFPPEVWADWPHQPDQSVSRQPPEKPSPAADSDSAHGKPEVEPPDEEIRENKPVLNAQDQAVQPKPNATPSSPDDRNNRPAWTWDPIRPWTGFLGHLHDPDNRYSRPFRWSPWGVARPHADRSRSPRAWPVRLTSILEANSTWISEPLADVAACWFQQEQGSANGVSSKDLEKSWRRFLQFRGSWKGVVSADLTQVPSPSDSSGSWWLAPAYPFMKQTEARDPVSSWEWNQPFSSTVIQLHFLAIPRAAKHPEASARSVAWLMDRVQQERLERETGFLSPAAPSPREPDHQNKWPKGDWLENSEFRHWIPPHPTPDAIDSEPVTPCPVEGAASEGETPPLLDPKLPEKIQRD